MLSEPERAVLRCLEIFMGGFTLDAACAVVSDPGLLKGDVIDAVTELVEKSLAVVETAETEPRLRLLETTRTYALERLAESGEWEAVAHRHAEFYRDLFEKAETESEARPAAEWLVDYAQEIDNLRASLDWAFSPNGDPKVGVALTTAAVPLWMRLSLLEKCRRRAKQVLGALGAGGIWDPRNEMRLSAALGASSSEAPEMGAAFTKALEIAENLGDVSYQLRALQGLQFYHAANRRYRAALPFAQKFHDLAMRGSDPSVRLAGECMIGAIQHTLGDQISARLHLEQVLTHYAASNHAGKAIRLQDFFRFGIEVQISARVFLARVLWLQGFSDQALRAAETSLGEATGHDYSVCYALAFAACPIALWVGNLAAAAHYAGMLLGHSRRHGSPLWAASGSRFHKIVALKCGVLETKSRLPLSGPNEVAKPSSSFQFLTGLSELAEALAHTGRIAEGLVLLEAEIESSETSWLTPELLRLKGELLLLQGTPSAAETPEALFRQALDEARRHGALSWELRAATSLARLLRDRDRIGEASDLLAPIYQRFTEGFGTADLQAAKRLIDALS